MIAVVVYLLVALAVDTIALVVMVLVASRDCHTCEHLAAAEDDLKNTVRSLTAELNLTRQACDRLAADNTPTVDIPLDENPWTWVPDTIRAIRTATPADFCQEDQP